MKYWLLKSEPNAYSWNDLVKDGSTHWDGVRNFQARNFMMQMKKGDLAFFYHSINDKAIIGIMKIIKEYYPDPSDKKNQFIMVDLAPVKKLADAVSLSTIKSTDSLDNIGLIKQSRLSVMPITEQQWSKILELGNTSL